MNQKERFLSAGIPYKEIDKELINLIDVLNFDLNLKTEYCCYGHKNGQEMYIFFNECVTEEQILDLANFLAKSKREISLPELGIYFGAEFGEFNKNIVTKDKKLLIRWNWIYRPAYNANDISFYETVKKKFVEKVLADLSDYRKLKEVK